MNAETIASAERKQIVCVDDDRNVLEGLRRALRPMCAHWDTYCTDQPEDAWKQAAAGRADVLVTDVKMPRMSGLELIQRIRAHAETSDLPIVVMTGLTEPHLKERALTLGAIDLLSKPIDSRELTARLESAIRMKERFDRLKSSADQCRREADCARREARRMRLQMVCRLGRIAEHHDAETGNHVARVAAASRVIAASLGLSQSEIDNLLFAAPLHDIGKIAIPESILAKAGPLDDCEWAVMRRHCEFGAMMLREPSQGMTPLLRLFGDHSDWLAETDPLMETAAAIALAHHERWDGAGYPYGLSGEAIPLEARIVAVADVFDALLSPRPYKKAFSEDEAMDAMRRAAGTHFDPVIYAAFERTRDAILAIRNRWADGYTIDDLGSDPL